MTEPIDSPVISASLDRRRLIGLGAVSVLSSLVPYAGEATSVALPDIGNVSENPLRIVDPQLRTQALLTPQTINGATLAEARARMTSGVQPLLGSPRIVERAIPAASGTPDVRVLVLNASSAGRVLRPAILHMHGGGFVAGSPRGEAAMMQQMAIDHDCVVVSVDYRLAPETRFPGPLEDNYAALVWLYANAESLGVDRSRIALMGVSGGGGHAAMLAALARDRGEVPVLFQLLISPMLDDRTGSTRPVPPGIGTFVWTPQSNRFCWSSFLGVPAGSRRVPLGAVPARMPDFRKLPPTYMGVGAIDLFVGENIDYAAQLVTAGVPTELNVVPGAYHVFFAIKPNADVSKRFRTSFNQALERAFRPSSS